MTGDPLIGHLAELCRCHAARAKWLIVPGHSPGLTLADRLAREGTDWANLRVVTPLDLATRVAGPSLVEQRIDPSEEQLGPALVMRLLLALPGAAGYFRPMAQHHSMAEALWRAIRELRYAGVRADDLAAVRFTPVVAKQAELVELLRAYESHLHAAKLADMPMVYEEALRQVRSSPVAAGDLVVELPGAAWPPVVRRFLDALPGQRAAAPAGARWPASARPARTEIFRAGGRDAEIDEVFRRIARSGMRLDQVEIACSSSVPPSLVLEKASRLGWPVTLSAGVPAAATRPGRLLLRFCDWVESDFEAAELRRLLQSGDCWSKGLGGEEADLTPGQAARLLLRAQATWGRETYRLALARACEEYERGASDPEASDEERGWNVRKARQGRGLLSWVEAVLERVPSPDPSSGTVPLASLVDAAVAFLRENAARWGGQDALALESTVSAVSELRILGPYECQPGAALRFIRERLASLSVGCERPRPGRLHVSPLREAGYDGRSLVFVVGLEEGAVFPAAVEEPVLLDDDRRAIGAELPTSKERQESEVEKLLSRLDALCRSADRACYSYSCRDTREFRETFPSWIVLGAYRLQQGDPSATYRQLAAALGEPVSQVPASPGAAGTDSAWWLSNMKASGAREAVLRAFPSLARGLEARAERASTRFTVFDGLVADAGPALDPARAGRPVSATALESAAACPLRYFMTEGLGVRPIEEGQADRDTWLDARTKGSELHALYARVMRAARSEKRSVSLAADRSRLRDWGSERLEALRREMPPPSDEVFSREAREFLDDLDAFIEAECEGRHGDDPVGFEVPFGFPLEEGEPEPLASADPVEVPLGHGRRLALRGRIDRINRLNAHGYEVADYKGSYWREAWTGTFRGGTLLQHALYGVAAARLLARIDPRARVVQARYLFPSVRGLRGRKEIPAPTPAKLSEVLGDLVDVIARGAFAPATEDGACKWCEYAGACHAGDHAAVQSKTDDEQNEILSSYRRLRSHE